MWLRGVLRPSSRAFRLRPFLGVFFLDENMLGLSALEQDFEKLIMQREKRQGDLDLEVGKNNEIQSRTNTPRDYVYKNN